MGTLAAGIKEIFATAKTTGSNVLLCGNDGTPDGHMTMANLASVLGVANVGLLTGYSTLADAYNAQNSFSIKHYTIQGSSVSDFPSGSSPNGSNVLMLKWNNGAGQMLYWNYLSNGFWCRRTYDNGIWTDWVKMSYDVPDFYKNYADLSSLASALGAPTPKGILSSNDDANNIFTNSIYYIWGGNVANIPGSLYGVLLTLDGGTGSVNGSRYTQIYFGYNGDFFYRIAFRDNNGKTWQPWYKITTTRVDN